ncbi:hypothetical protein [Streptomyces sp. SS8]
MSRMKRQAEQNRTAAKELRERSRGTSPTTRAHAERQADALEARAAELESGRVTDVTDQVLSLWSWARGR